VLLSRAGAAILSVRVYSPGDPHVTVWVRWAEYPAEVIVTEGERIGQGRLERYIGPNVATNREWAIAAVGGQVGRQPTVHFPSVPSRMLDEPGVAGRRYRLAARSHCVEAVREQVAVRLLWIGLVKNVSPGAQL